MKIISALFTLILLTSHPRAADPGDALATSVRSAMAAKNLQAMKSLYIFTKVSPEAMEGLLALWPYTFKDLEKGWSIAECRYFSKADYLAAQEDAGKKISRWEAPVNVGGETYIINAPITGVVVFELSAPDGKGKQTCPLPVGARPDGSLGLLGLKESPKGDTPATN